MSLYSNSESIPPWAAEAICFGHIVRSPDRFDKQGLDAFRFFFEGKARIDDKNGAVLRKLFRIICCSHTITTTRSTTRPTNRLQACVPTSHVRLNASQSKCFLLFLGRSVEGGVCQWRRLRISRLTPNSSSSLAHVRHFIPPRKNVAS